MKVSVYKIMCILPQPKLRMSKNKVLNLKDKIDGNEMDLSLCNLTEVPVKELVGPQRHTHYLYKAIYCMQQWRLVE